eukprot:3928432-Amphidinium_carterae.1
MACRQLLKESVRAFRGIHERGIEVLERVAKLINLIFSGVEKPLYSFLWSSSNCFWPKIATRSSKGSAEGTVQQPEVRFMVFWRTNHTMCE